MPYGRKNILFYKNDLILTLSDIFKNAFVLEFSLVIASYRFIKNDLIFTIDGSFFRGKYSLEI